MIELLVLILMPVAVALVIDRFTVRNPITKRVKSYCPKHLPKLKVGQVALVDNEKCYLCLDKHSWIRKYISTNPK